MQYYDNEKDKKRSRLIGLIAAGVYFVLFFVVALLIEFKTEADRPLVDYGMLIDFGVTESGMGDHEVQMSEGMALPESGGPNYREAFQTQDSDPNAPAITQQTSDRPSNNTPQTSRDDRQAAVQERQINPEALFPGRGDGNSTSDGTGDTPGNQGHPSGGAGGSRDGTGTGDSGVAYNLTGRTPIGSLSKPRYEVNVQGIVVIEVIVDERGHVTSAAFRGQGSTTQNADLVREAIGAAKKSQFTANPGADPQRGTITYTFRLK